VEPIKSITYKRINYTSVSMSDVSKFEDPNRIFFLLTVRLARFLNVEVVTITIVVLVVVVTSALEVLGLMISPTTNPITAYTKIPITF